MGLGIGQHFADRQDRVRADHHKATFAHTQLAITLPRAGGLQSDDQ